MNWWRRLFFRKRLEELQSFEKIYAPFDGVITARNTDIGHLINSGAGTPGAELFHIAALQTRWRAARAALGLDEGGQR